MALIKCHECGQKISSKAKTCPSCGVKPKPKTSKFTWLVALIMGVGLYHYLSNAPRVPSNPTKTVEVAEVETPPTPEEIRQTKIKRQFSSWDGSHTLFEKMIKKSMHNPDSYEHVETKYIAEQDHLSVVTKFRGSNAFGGIITNEHAAKFSIDGKFIEMIN